MGLSQETKETWKYLGGKIMSYIKTLDILNHNQEIECPFCKIPMEITKELFFKCPRCDCEVWINKKTIDINHL